MKYYLLLLAVMSVVLFVVMGADKSRARRHARRIPERTLFTLALLGGAFGGWLGMYMFHHKTKHWYFAAGFPTLAAAQAAVYFVLPRLIQI